MKHFALMVGAALFSAVSGSPCALYNGIRRCQDTRISRLYAHSDGSIYIRPADGFSSDFQCSDDYLVLKKEHANFNQIFQMLHSAQINGSAVKFRMGSGQDQCSISYIVIDS